MADQDQRTEQATPKRLEKARKEGQFPSFREFAGGLQFLLFVALLNAWGAGWLGGLRKAMRQNLARAFMPLSGGDIVVLSRDLVWQCLFLLAPAGMMLVLLTVAVQLAGTRMGLSWKKLSPDPGRLNPLARLRELPRQNLPALAKAAVLVPVFGVAVYGLVKENLDGFLLLPLQSVESGTRQVTASLQQILWKAAGAFVILGCVDLFRQQRKYRRDLRMSKQEIRDESKEMEGNPQIKSRIRRLQRERLRHQMMKEVPTATAVIVNPTHYAVAIRYSLESSRAPMVVAKGKNYLALRIRQRAIEHEVPIVENPPLARALYQAVDIGEEIPTHLYRAVAEILAYIYRLMKGHLPDRR